jgi:SAM-dependent methyltransferase
MSWFSSLAGKQFLLTEQFVIESLINEKFGYFAIQLGNYDCNFLARSRIAKHLFNGGKYQNISFFNSALPIKADSVDLIICPHIIEQTSDVQFLFNELYRAIIPGGHAVFVSFNPYSFAGLRRLFGFENTAPWNGNLVPPSSIQKSLISAGFTIDEAKMSNYQLIFNDEAINFNVSFESIGSRWLPFFGNICFIVAKKIETSVTPIKPKWIKPRKLSVVINKGHL